MANAKSTESSEAKELSLIGKVELRFALADTDAKLESLLKTYLAPLLLKLASEHLSVRNKVISVCQHIDVRIKAQDIRLPVAALLKQFKEHPTVSLIRHFDLIYIRQGIGRLSDDEKLELLPILVQGLAQDVAGNESQAAQLLHLFFRLVGYLPLAFRGTKDDQELRAKLNLSTEDASCLSWWCGKLILLHTASAATADASVRQGLSAREHRILSMPDRPDAWNPTTESGLSLTDTKVNVMRFLASGAFSDEERFFPALFASADTNNRLSEIGEDALKRSLLNVDLENFSILSQLYALYLGSPEADGAWAVRPPLRTKILRILVKSKRSASFQKEIMALVEELVLPASNERARPSLPPKPGLEALKLRSALFSFLSFVARNGSPSAIEIIASKLVDTLKTAVDNALMSQDEGNIDLRGQAYEAIGLFAKACYKSLVLEPRLILLTWLVDHLRNEQPAKAAAVGIEEAISSILGAVAGPLEPEIENVLASFLLTSLLRRQQSKPSFEAQSSSQNSITKSVRFNFIAFANRCLAYTNVTARWIDIIAMGDSPENTYEIIEEGRRGLDPHWYQVSNAFSQGPGNISQADTHGMRFEFPRFSDLALSIFPSCSDVSQNQLMKGPGLHQFHDYGAASFSAALKYCRNVFLNEALNAKGIVIKIDPNWERNLTNAIMTDYTNREHVRSYIKEMSTELESQDVAAFRVLLKALYGATTGVKVTDLADHAENLVQLIGLSSDALLVDTAMDPGLFKDAMFSSQDAVRRSAAHAYGLLASLPSAEMTLAKEMPMLLLQKVESWSSAIGAALNEVEGAAMALSFYLSRSFLRGQRSPQLEAMLQKLMGLVFSMLDMKENKSLQKTSFGVLAEFSTFYILNPVMISNHRPYKAVVDMVLKSAKAGNEKATHVLGRLGMIAREEEQWEDSEVTYPIEKLYELHETRQVEAQFAVGEGLSCIAIGWESSVLASTLDLETARPVGPKRQHVLRNVLGRTLENCRQTKPSLRKASVIWLLCLIQFCGTRGEIQKRLRDCQMAFKQCLSDRDEVVQEASSRGLGLVYEKGDRELKNELVRDLVNSFSDDKAQLAGNVTADTQLFEPGALPTGDGSVTTYKDIMNLAAEVGDSSLVYRFMSLATNNALWSTRAAFGRFGLSSVLSDSSVDGYLSDNPKLYPKLFRYRFDPNSNVRRSMNDIWNALVKDSVATIDKHFDNILEDLLQNILAREWRVRQASCAAIADLLQGRPLEKYETYLTRIWELTFKVLDDIKETVRVAAASLARTLTGILTRSLEAGDASSKKSASTLKHVLPFLLSTSGLESSAQEVQAFALDTLLGIIKKGSGQTIRPFIPELIERLAGLLSSLEPQAVNYIHLNASKYNLTEQKIDDMRLASIRGSPLMEAIERCLDLLNEEAMTELRPRLESAMNSAVGLPSKVGCSRILVSLSTRHNLLFRPYADDFLKILQKHLNDRNETVSSAYAVAAGYVTRTASDKQILRLLDYCKTLYFASEDDRRRTTAGETVYAMSKHATDRFNSIAVDILPFVFIAKHDTQISVRERFQDTWNENVGGSRAIQLYLKEIVAIAEGHLTSNQWVIKHTAALSLAEAIYALSSSSSNISNADGAVVWPALVKAVGGKTWDGKEKVLRAFVKFVQKGADFWKSDEDVANEIVRIIAREARRQNPTYREYAIKALGEVALERDDIDMTDLVIDIVAPVIEALTTGDDVMEADGVNGQRNGGKSRDHTLAATVETLLDAINPAAIGESKVVKKLSEHLRLATQACKTQITVVQQAMFGGLKRLFGRLKASKVHIFEDQAENLREQLVHVLLGDASSLNENLRQRRSDAIVALATLDENMPSVLLSRLTDELPSEISPVVRQNLEQALGLARKQ